MTVIQAHWRGKLEPLSAFFGAILLAAVAIAVIRMFVWAVNIFVMDLAVGSIIELIGAALTTLVIIWLVVGLFRTACDVNGRSGWILLGVTAAGLLAMSPIFRSAVANNVEYVDILRGQDPVGEAATIEMKDGRIYFTGNIVRGVAGRFDKLTQAAPAGTIVMLDSEGGREWEATRIASLIAERGFHTQADRSCSSACTLMLVAGKERAADIYAEIGFHQTSTAGSMESEGAWLSESLKSSYLSYGLDADFVDAALAIVPDELWAPEPSELLDANVVDRITVEAAVARDIDWIKESVPWNIEGDWLVVDSAGEGRRLDMVYGFIPGSPMARDTIDLFELESSARRILCESDFYRPLVEYGAAVRMLHVDDAALPITVSECPDIEKQGE